MGKSSPDDGPLSLAAWFKTTERSQPSTVIHGSAGSQAAQALLEITGGRPRALVRRDNASPNVQITHPTDLADGRWHHLVMTFTGGTDDTLRLFVDGRLSGAQSQALGRLAIPDWYVGKQYGGTNYFGGWLDDVRMYDRALSDGGVSVVGQAAGGDVGELYALRIPEPGSLGLLASGLAGLWLLAAIGRCRFRGPADCDQPC